MKQRSIHGYLAVTAAAILWGLSGALAKYMFANKAIPPLLLVQVRVGFAFLLLFTTLAITAPHLLRINRRDLGYTWVWGVLGLTGLQSAYLFTISETNVATAIFMQYLAPVFTALYAWLVEGERLSRQTLISLGVALGGSYLLVFGLSGQLMVSPLGLATGLASAIGLTIYSVLGAKRPSHLSPWTLLCYGLGMGIGAWLVVDLIGWLTGHPIAPLAPLADPSLWPFFIYIASLATVIPFGLYLIGLRWLSPTQATVNGMLEPVTGGIAAFFLVSERLEVGQTIGAVLIVVAIILMQMSPQESTEADEMIHLGESAD